MLDALLACLDGFSILLTLQVTEPYIQQQDVQAVASLSLLWQIQTISHLLRHVLIHRENTLVQILSIDILLLIHELLTDFTNPLVVVHYPLKSLIVVADRSPLNFVDLEPDVNVIADKILLLLGLVDVVNTIMILHFVI